jgi:FHA domain-containing protein
MSLGEFLEKFGRTVFEAPLAGARSAELKEPAELAEIRLAVLDQVKARSYRSGGKKVFPYDLLRIHLRGLEESRREVFAGAFFRRYLEQEIAAALRNAGCRYPENLRVEVHAVTGLPQRGEDWLVVDAVARELPEGGAVPARLVVREGKANVESVPITKARINIGRVVDVYRDKGLFRRNDLAFVEDNEINRTVSREHAHIRFDRATGECRIFNDRWYARGQTGECGTWIVRDGMSQEVHRDSRGVKLEPGDEIHFGSAVVEFETASSTEA